MKKLFCFAFIAVFAFCALFSGKAAAADGDDVASDALQYLMYIGTNLKDRSAITSGRSANDGNAHEEAAEWIVASLKAAGVSDEQIEEQRFEQTDQSVTYDCTNIVVTLQGKENAKQILVGAHYDGDGCGDNGSGVALLLAEIKSLAGQSLPYKVVFIFFDAEEAGEFGSNYYVEHMSAKEKNNTLYMVNIDSIAFGDYCNIYGGTQNDAQKTVSQTGAYELFMKKAAELGITAYTTEDLDGYYAKNGEGPEIEPNAVYTNPWTYSNPSPADADGSPECASPSTGYWGDHVPFEDAGIPYVYLEATNWYAKGDGGINAYTGYFETDDATLGESGMFMNTPYDTLSNLNALFPGRALQHFELYSKILTGVLLSAETPEKEAASPNLPLTAGIVFVALLVFGVLLGIVKKRKKRSQVS